MGRSFRELSGIATLLCVSIVCALVAQAEADASSSTVIEPDPALLALMRKGTRETYSGDNDAARETFSELARVAPDHPAADFFLASILFDRSAVDLGYEGADAQILGLLGACRRKAEAILRKDPDDAGALFFLGQADVYEGRLLAQRGHFLRGGLMGEKGRGHLERALGAHPEAADLRLPLGGYYYFASLLPGALQKLDFLPFIPKGSRDEGLAYLETAAAEGVLFQDSARFLLAVVYFRIEKRTDLALAHFDRLRADFPFNPLIEIQYGRALTMAGRLDEARAVADRLAECAAAGTPTCGELVDYATRLIRIEIALRAGDPEAARGAMADLRANTSIESTSLLPWLDVYSGMLCDLEGDRQAAEAAYKRTDSYPRRLRNFAARRMAREFLDAPFSPNQTVLNRLTRTDG